MFPAVRVLIDTTYSRCAPLSGTAVYIRRLCEELARRDRVDLVEVENRRRRPPAGGGIGSVRNLLIDRWWTAVELPRLARRARADIIHHPLPARARLTGVVQVVTVVDLAFERLPELFDRRFRAYARWAHRSAALKAGAVVCISETTAADARSLWGVPPEQIVVASLGPGQELPRVRAEREHFLYVGDDEPRKNLRTLLDAYRRYRVQTESPLPLVLAGSAVADGPGIRAERHPPKQRLAELYAGAVALIHPSLYEGFGLTALEAMNAGAPVIAADAPGVKEVCADAARYADPHDAASFAAAMVEIAAQPAMREQLVERGRARAAEFSWDRCARAHVEAYSLAQKRA
jgi:glycosyltransferase involved in cell wall biosynthesis